MPTIHGWTEDLQTGSLVSTATTADQAIVTRTIPAGKKSLLLGFSVMACLTTFATTATHFGTVSLEINGTKKATIDVAHAGNPVLPVQIDFQDGVQVKAGDVVRLVCAPTAVTSFTWRGCLTILQRG